MAETAPVKKVTLDDRMDGSSSSSKRSQYS